MSIYTTSRSTPCPHEPLGYFIKKTSSNSVTVTITVLSTELTGIDFYTDLQPSTRLECEQDGELISQATKSSV